MNINNHQATPLKAFIGTFIFLFILSGCGLKGSLYQTPTPIEVKSTEQKQQPMHSNEEKTEQKENNSQ